MSSPILRPAFAGPDKRIAARFSVVFQSELAPELGVAVWADREEACLVAHKISFENT
jgi:hypothetical protein